MGWRGPFLVQRTTQHKENSRCRLSRTRLWCGRLVEELMGGGDVSLVAEILSPDFVEHEELPPGTPSGYEGFAQYVTMLHAAFPDFTLTVEDMVAEGDKVTVRHTGTGTHEGEFMGMPATGKSITIPGIDILRVKDGKVVEHGGLTDMSAMM